MVHTLNLPLSVLPRWELSYPHNKLPLKACICTQAKYGHAHKHSAHLDVLQEDSPSPLVLNFHQLLSVLTFFVGLVLEKLSKVVQGLVITIKVIRLRQRRR